MQKNTQGPFANTSPTDTSPAKTSPANTSPADTSSSYIRKYNCPLEQLSRRLEQVEQFEDNPRLAIACSGGGDSLALLLLCKEWWLKKYDGSSGKREHPRAKIRIEKSCEHNIVALICDHRTRAESTGECQRLKETIEKQFELSANILTAPSFANQRGNLQQNMRHFRLKACLEWCRENAAIHLLFGHTQDDQVETLLLQRANRLRGSGAMRELGYARHARIIRPMLEIRRLDLRKWLSARNISWLEDPSNQSNSYARNRLRHELEVGRNNDGKNNVRSILDTCERIRSTNSVIDKQLEDFTAQYVALYPEGYARIESREFLKLQEPAARRLISSLAQRVGGRHVRGMQVKQILPLWREKMEHFLANTKHSSAIESRARQENKPPTLSLGRTLLLANKSNGFFIVRALVASEELDISMHKGFVPTKIWMQKPLWDGRYRILPAFRPSQQPIALTCRFLGRDGIEQLRAATKNKASQKNSSVVQAMWLFETLHARIREACPAFWQNDQLRALPTLMIYRNFPQPKTPTRDYEEKNCWLSTKESAQLPRIRWEPVEQQNIEKNTIFNSNPNP